MFWCFRRSSAALELLHRYPFVVDERRSVEISQLWTADATLVLPDQKRLTGRDVIVDYFLGLWGAQADTSTTLKHPGLRHHIANVRLDRSGSAIRASSYYFALSRKGADHWGIYSDVIDTTRDGARFRERVVSLTGCVADSVIAGIRPLASD